MKLVLSILSCNLMYFVISTINRTKMKLLPAKSRRTRNSRPSNAWRSNVSKNIRKSCSFSKTRMTNVSNQVKSGNAIFQMFCQIQGNDEGNSLCRNKFCEWCEATQQKVSFSSVEEKWLFGDDGLVLREEFESLILLAPMTSVIFYLNDVTEYLSIVAAFQIFNLIDFDGDGTINADNYSKWARKYPISHSEFMKLLQKEEGCRPLDFLRSIIRDKGLWLELEIQTRLQQDLAQTNRGSELRIGDHISQQDQIITLAKVALCWGEHTFTFRRDTVAYSVFSRIASACSDDPDQVVVKADLMATFLSSIVNESITCIQLIYALNVAERRGAEISQSDSLISIADIEVLASTAQNENGLDFPSIYYSYSTVVSKKQMANFSVEFSSCSDPFVDAPIKPALIPPGPSANALQIWRAKTNAATSRYKTYFSPPPVSNRLKLIKQPHFQFQRDGRSCEAFKNDERNVCAEEITPQIIGSHLFGRRVIRSWHSDFGERLIIFGKKKVVYSQNKTKTVLISTPRQWFSDKNILEPDIQIDCAALEMILSVHNPLAQRLRATFLKDDEHVVCANALPSGIQSKAALSEKDKTNQYCADSHNAMATKITEDHVSDLIPSPDIPRGRNHIITHSKVSVHATKVHEQKNMINAKESNLCKPIDGLKNIKQKSHPKRSVNRFVPDGGEQKVKHLNVDASTKSTDSLKHESLKSKQGRSIEKVGAPAIKIAPRGNNDFTRPLNAQQFLAAIRKNGYADI